MKILQKLSFRATHAFTDFFLKYIEQDKALRPFYSQFPSVENFELPLREKAAVFPDGARKTLVETLNAQYKNISPVPTAVAGNIEKLLDRKTFTVTTGHQLNIFTGPLYFIYKIVTVINACRDLKARYPEYTFVPVYWMASEDHDYEEIKSFRMNGSTFTWETDQKGAVGRFDPRSLDKVISSIPGDISVFREAYLKNKTLGDAVRSYVTRLFGSYGLVVIDADSRALKKQFQTVIHEDLFNHTPCTLVTKTSADLELLGFHPQVNARTINFFFLDKQSRTRIEKIGDRFTLVDTDVTFTGKELESLLDKEPERFSPNVILRPLYQEMILPNLAYVGGPAELVYWLQLKSMFEHFKVQFPVLMPRNFALVVDGPTQRKVAKTGLAIAEFFEEKNYLFNQWVTKNSEHDLSLGVAMKEVDSLFKEIVDRCSKIDVTLGSMTLAETKRVQNTLEKIEKKMLRAEKRKKDDRLRQIGSVKDHLFPGGGLQERTENFLTFYQQDESFIARLTDQLGPFDYQFNVLGND